MAEEEVERFEVTDWDLANESGYGRQHRKLSKKQQIYGVFADSDEDDSGDDKRSKKGKGRAPDKGRKNYTAPVAFTSGGVQGGSSDKKDEEQNKDEAKSDDSEEEELNARPSFGGKKSAQNRLAGMGFSRGGGKGASFGSWEQHTKGIGSSILRKMGFEEGKGLGKNLQGITAPIVAHKREGRGAIGLYGPEKPTAVIADSAPAKSLEGKETVTKPAKGQWRKRNQATGDLKYSVKSVSDLLTDGTKSRAKKEMASKLGNVKVIDMTGPEQKVLNSYDELHGRPTRPSDAVEGPDTAGAAPAEAVHFELNELQHNLDILVEMTEQEIIQQERRKEHLENSLVNLTHAKKELEVTVGKQRGEMQRYKAVQDIVQKLESDFAGFPTTSTLTMAEVTNVFRLLQNDYYAEYRMFELDDIAPIIVFPMIRNELVPWSPLRKPEFCADLFKTWKDLLERPAGSVGYMAADAMATDMYFRLVWDVWLPFVRAAIIQWQVKKCDPMIDLIETWYPILPPAIVVNILEQLIMPRIQQEVDQWYPLMDPVPIHSWIQPWLPLMKNRLEIVFPPIRQKLGNALTAWHPSDDSGRRVLSPWADVFEPGAMSAFVVKFVQPKLERVFDEYVINPGNQSFDELQWVLSWQDLLPSQSMVTLFAARFFPKWLSVLGLWLGQGSAESFNDITDWYSDWKQRIPDALKKHPVIDAQFKRALDIMNAAASVPAGQFNYQAYLAKVGAANIPAPSKPAYEPFQQQTRPTVAAGASNISLSFKDLIERKAAESGIVFMPIPNRSFEGKPVFRLGEVFIYLEHNVTYKLDEKTGKWVPTSLASLFDMAGSAC